MLIAHRLYLILALLLFATVPFSLRSAEPLVFVLAGQSNMEGRGQVDELSADQRAVPDNVVFYFWGKRRALIAGKQFGPELTFAQEIAKAHPDRQVIIHKGAIGGTSMTVWNPDWTAEDAALTQNQGNAPLYARLVDGVGPHLQQKGLRVHAIAWMQGERDSRYPEIARDYGRRLDILARRLRADLASPDARFIAGQIDPPRDKFPHAETVRAAQRDAVRTIPHFLLVETDDLTKHPDQLHYDTAGQLELGRRFARAFLADFRPGK